MDLVSFITAGFILWEAEVTGIAQWQHLAHIEHDRYRNLMFKDTATNLVIIYIDRANHWTCAATITALIPVIFCFTF